MALRNYLYAKHSDSNQSALINKSQVPQSPAMTRFPRRGSHVTPKPVESNNECPPERLIKLDDGTTKCANCADCPRKAHDEVSPRIMVEVSDRLPEEVSRMSLEVDYTLK